MNRRTVIIGLLAIWGVFALVGWRSCAGRFLQKGEPQASLASNDPSEVSQAYWLAGRQASIKCGNAQKPIVNLSSKAKVVQDNPSGHAVWSELAQSYSQTATVETEAINELMSLPRDRVDPVVVECVNELLDYLTQDANVMRQTGEQCRDMAVLLSMINAEGNAFDWNSEKGDDYKRRKADVISRMKRTLENEGADSRRRLAEWVQSLHSPDFPTEAVDL